MDAEDAVRMPKGTEVLGIIDFKNYIGKVGVHIDNKRELLIIHAPTLFKKQNSNGH